MSEFSVRTSVGEYSVEVGVGILGEMLLRANTAVVDDVVASLVAVPRGPSIIRFHASEQNKTLAGCQEILIAMNSCGMKRGDELLAVGGGALQDVATLAASIYMRGVPWTYVPTTAMAMLDSCIGGKSSINVAGVKNLVGNIYPPTRVVVDVSVADTLPIEARVSGLGEAVKICFVAGPLSLRTYLDLDVGAPSFGAVGSEVASVELVTHVLRTKKWFIEVDEFDKKERLLLNFGHTFGHALESGTGFAVPHGVGIAFGMLAALSHPLSVSSESGRRLRTYLEDLLRSVPEAAAVASSAMDWSVFRSSIASDKKSTRDAIRLVLPSGEQPVAIVDVPRTDKNLTEIEDCMRTALAVDVS